MIIFKNLFVAVMWSVISFVLSILLVIWLIETPGYASFKQDMPGLEPFVLLFMTFGVPLSIWGDFFLKLARGRLTDF